MIEWMMSKRSVWGFFRASVGSAEIPLISLMSTVSSLSMHDRQSLTLHRLRPSGAVCHACPNLY